ncbi:hypothetical protein OH786_32445 [Streptomyces atratus]|uniref:hypothetical protein n=1 Tax=Streptomyces atratus TaxID=1893 RepID=UPI00324AED40
MWSTEGTSRSWRTRATAVVAAYLRACTVRDAYATSPLASAPDAALTAARTDAPLVGRCP